MRTIWKFPLRLEDETPIIMPRGAQVLCVQTQRGQPCIWAQVETDETAQSLRKFVTRGTGHPIDDRAGRYVGTYQIHDGDLVFHVFDVSDGGILADAPRQEGGDGKA